MRRRLAYVHMHELTFITERTQTEVKHAAHVCLGAAKFNKFLSAHEIYLHY